MRLEAIIMKPRIDRLSSLAIFGTASGVGKSTVVTGLCRAFSNRGILVSPFKAQNISNNAGVTSDGLEMSRAQITQAQAARIEPHIDMNPVLLKPQQNGFQRIINGMLSKQQNDIFLVASRSFNRLGKKYQTIIIEGAGSCAEVNLLKTDPCNFRIAKLVGAPVILVADMYHGGVFSQIIGTLVCLPQKYQDMIIGFIINRFTGSRRAFKKSIIWLEQETGKPVLGVLPVIDSLNLPDEDVAEKISNNTSSPSLHIGIVKLPHIANTSDFVPLRDMSDITVDYLDKPRDLSVYSAVILPGTKCTIDDLLWLRKSEWASYIYSYARANRHLLGICGGMQLLGQSIHDPDHIEHTQTIVAGLGLLPIRTTFQSPKVTNKSTFYWDGIRGEGYEIHMGRTELTADVYEHGSILGTYMHGFLIPYAVRSKWLKKIGYAGTLSCHTDYDKQYETLAKKLEKYIDITGLIKKMNT